MGVQPENPSAQNVDDRYEDAENKEQIDDHMVADLKIGYTKKDIAFFNALKVSLEFTNLFDEAYVSLINGMDDSRAGSTSCCRRAVY